LALLTHPGLRGPNMSSGAAPESLSTAAEHLMAAKMFSLASCVMLFYDMAITFFDEVERIWKQKFSGATILWFLNRYLSPLGYIVIIVSFHANWPTHVCDAYVLYPEILKIFTAFTIGVIFILRLYAIYSRSQVILVAFTVLLLGELGTKIWAFTDGTRLVLPPELHGCILTGRSASGKRIVYTWVAELVFDTAVFLATVYRTVSLYRSSRIGPSSNLVKVIMRDGIIYFGVIFASNLVTVLIFVAAPPDLKVVNASFSTLITSLMVSRLMLNLRQEALRRGTAFDSRYVISQHSGGTSNARMIAAARAGHTTGSHIDFYDSRTESWFPPSTNPRISVSVSQAYENAIIGNLGAPMEGWGEDEDEGSEVDYGPGDRRSQGGNMTELEVEMFRLRAKVKTKFQPIAVEVTEEVLQVVDRDPARLTPNSVVDIRRRSPRSSISSCVWPGADTAAPTWVAL